MRVTFYGYVSATDPGTGQPDRPLLLNVTAPRAKFETFVLSALDPIACLKGELTALVSLHPYDHEPVRPWSASTRCSRTSSSWPARTS
jgi:restriction system protein